jgi:hypothetical protein
MALPLQPELEAIDKIKNTYIWDTSRVWQHPGLRPQDLERLLEGDNAALAFHVEAPGAAEVDSPVSPRERMEAVLAVTTAGETDPVIGVATPNFVVAEISKAVVMPGSLAGLEWEAH